MNEQDIKDYDRGVYDAVMGWPMEENNGWAYESGYTDQMED